MRPRGYRPISDAPDVATLEIRFSRLWTTFIVAVLSVITGIAVLFAVKAWPTRLPLFSFSLVLAVSLGLAVLHSMRRLLNPPLMFSVDSQGITIFFDGLDFVSDGLFVSWGRIRSLSLTQRTEAGGGSLRVRTVAVQVTEGEAIPSERSAGGSDDPLVFHLDATSGSLRGQKLLAAIERFGPR